MVGCCKLSKTRRWNVLFLVGTVFLTWPVESVGTNERAPLDPNLHGINAPLLSTAIHDELVIEVDTGPECTPDRKALKRFVDTVERIVAPKKVTLEIDDVITAKDWPRKWEEDSLDSVAQRWLDIDPSDGRQRLYILYVSRTTKRFGAAGGLHKWIVERNGIPVHVSGAYINCRAIDRMDTPLVSRRKLEEFVLVHEFGHVLGLTTNPVHEQVDAPHHCTERRCVMRGLYGCSVVGSVMTLLVGTGIHRKFGPECLADLDRVRRFAGSRTLEDLHRWKRAMDADALSAWHWRHGRRAQALEALETADADQPGDFRILASLGRMRSWLSDTVGAVSALEAAVAAGAGDDERFALARQLCILGRYGEALEIMPSSPSGELKQDHLRTRLWALEGMGRLRDAVGSLDAFTKRRSVPRGQRDWAYVEMARLLLLAGDLRSARSYVEKNPGYPDYWTEDSLVTSSAIAAAAGDGTRAQADLAHLRRLQESALGSDAPEDAELDFRVLVLLDVFARQGDQVAFETLRDSLVSRLPGFDQETVAGFSGRYRIAKALAIAGDAQAALAMLREARGKEAPWNPTLDPCIDDDFAPVRELPGFRAFMPYCERNPPLSGESTAVNPRRRTKVLPQFAQQRPSRPSALEVPDKARWVFSEFHVANALVMSPAAY